MKTYKTGVLEDNSPGLDSRCSVGSYLHSCMGHSQDLGDCSTVVPHKIGPEEKERRTKIKRVSFRTLV